MQRIFALIIIILLSVNSSAQLQPLIIYDVTPEDTLLSKSFIQALCNSVREPQNREDLSQSTHIAALLSRAAGTFSGDVNQAVKMSEWWRRFGDQCFCEKSKKYEAGNLLRQIIFTDFRSFANLIGPNGQFPLQLHKPDREDGLTLLEFVTLERDKIQATHQHQRVKFQEDKNWKRLMFYFMLLTEYQVQYEVKQHEDTIR